MPVILIFCIVGAFAINNTVFGVGIILVLGLLAFLMEENGFPIAPTILGIVLGPLVEENFMTSMIKADGNLLGFFERPIAAVLGVITLAHLGVGDRRLDPGRARATVGPGFGDRGLRRAAPLRATHSRPKIAVGSDAVLCLESRRTGRRPSAYRRGSNRETIMSRSALTLGAGIAVSLALGLGLSHSASAQVAGGVDQTVGGTPFTKAAESSPDTANFHSNDGKLTFAIISHTAGNGFFDPAYVGRPGRRRTPSAST